MPPLTLPHLLTFPLNSIYKTHDQAKNGTRGSIREKKNPAFHNTKKNRKNRGSTKELQAKQAQLVKPRPLGRRTEPNNIKRKGKAQTIARMELHSNRPFPTPSTLLTITGDWHHDLTSNSLHTEQWPQITASHNCQLTPFHRPQNSSSDLPPTPLPLETPCPTTKL